MTLPDPPTQDLSFLFLFFAGGGAVRPRVAAPLLRRGCVMAVARLRLSQHLHTHLRRYAGTLPQRRMFMRARSVPRHIAPHKVAQHHPSAGYLQCHDKITYVALEPTHDGLDVLAFARKVGGMARAHRQT